MRCDDNWEWYQRCEEADHREARKGLAVCFLILVILLAIISYFDPIWREVAVLKIKETYASQPHHK